MFPLSGEGDLTFTHGHRNFPRHYSASRLPSQLYFSPPPPPPRAGLSEWHTSRFSHIDYWIFNRGIACLLAQPAKLVLRWNVSVQTTPLVSRCVKPRMEVGGGEGAGSYCTTKLKVTDLDHRRVHTNREGGQGYSKSEGKEKKRRTFSPSSNRAHIFYHMLPNKLMYLWVVCKEY